LTAVPAADIRRGDGDDVLEFISAYGRITKDSVAGLAGEPLVPRPWQSELIRRIFARRADGRRRHRIALVGMGRKNGKTALMAGVALYGLFAEGEGAQVFSCAADRDQAKLLFGDAKRMVEMSPELLATCRIYRDAIEVTDSGSVYRALSSEAYTKEGLSPTLVLYDELHAAPNRDLWDVMTLAQGARVDPLIIAPTTAGVRTDVTGGDSIAYTLYQHGKRVASGETDDPSFFFSWWEPDGQGEVSDPVAWAQANPGLGDILSEADMAAASASVPSRTPEAEFRIKRLNQWVNSATSWLPSGAFEARAVDRRLRPKERVVLGFDGSFNHDCTALVACTLDGFIDVLGLWERPADAVEWEVPVAEVTARVLAACRDYDVMEIAADPFRWSREIQEWSAAGLPAAEFPTTSAARMVPACAMFYDAVADGRLTHSGNPALVRHVNNAVVKVDRLGPRIVKENRGSSRNIDLAVAAVAAFDRATFYTSQPPKPRYASSGWV
jgi:phage terminase large subunit-like protein